ncbi:F0F1 ATP synthase subunit B [Candidatus Annandia pinicola]|uniref:F0F1 ATP synthase subunit B n=1 Tax=Candidatus Annandia pinicola TaxID=1345117 RepID=UPI001D02DADB|nr:F0F1 ATP synthase subunit B [Candidatus Annandia pinicola]UDG80506.1 ATP synthase subunit b [Candidatus Annandia pinicola]
MDINSTILGQTISFIIFVLFCMKYIWPPIINKINNHQKKIINELKKIELSKKNFKIIKNKMLQKIKKTKKISDLIIKNANKKSKKIIKISKKKSMEEHNKIIKNALIKIKLEIKIAKEKLKKDFSNLVIIGIKKITEKYYYKNNHEDLLNDIIKKL